MGVGAEESGISARSAAKRAPGGLAFIHLDDPDDALLERSRGAGDAARRGADDFRCEHGMHRVRARTAEPPTVANGLALSTRLRPLAALRSKGATMTTSSASSSKVHLSTLEIPLERDVFLRTLIRHLSAALEEVVGLEEAAGFISIVGQRMGDEIASSYKSALDVTRLDRDQVRDLCIDLKRRIKGDFYVISEDDEKIVFGNRACPFGDKVNGRDALCMMTSNVFGTIAAESLGYGKVVLEDTIAKGDAACRVVLYVKRSAAAEQAVGREYLASE
jgi:hypothetical protein